MASMTIRDLDDRLKQRLRIQAARNDRSMEEEARAILKAALTGNAGSARSLYKSIRSRIEPLGSIDLAAEPREPIRKAEIE
jgi:plasmid stability protein